MKTPWRDPAVEESRHTIVLQSRAGARLSILVHATHTELELVYKPHAARRRDHAARNFSNRDVFTTLFRRVEIVDLDAGLVERFAYDPFVTRLHVRAASSAANVITFLHGAGENAFGISADRPLALRLWPHVRFEAADDRVVETWDERGETITAFAGFTGVAENRFRPLDDGSCVVQIFGDEVLWLGGEESRHQADRALRALRPLRLPAALALLERTIEPLVRPGRVHVADADFQRVLDLNTRVLVSGMDEGGACFGALNRIYHLIWNRDGSQVAAFLARCGNPALLRTWAPFILANPSRRADPATGAAAEWLQILGTRWTKSEDDGIYYAFLSLFTLVETTGDTTLLDSPLHAGLLDGLDHAVRTRFDEAEGLFGSDTRGESTLRSSPFYGYDSVTGRMSRTADDAESFGSPFHRAFALYHNVNLYNALRMAAWLEHLAGRAGPRVDAWNALAARIAATLRARYVTPEGVYFADYAHLEDGTRRFLRFTDRNPDPDYWEYAWAVTTGPFFPDLGVALRSALHVRATWPAIRSHGWCPWNTLAAFLQNLGLLPGDAFHALLAQEVREARTPSQRYPMADALTEYAGDTEGWRPLPFTASSFRLALTGLVLHALPCGLAVRAGRLAEGVSAFHHRASVLDVACSGEGDDVRAWSIDGEPVAGTLQIPEDRLRIGRHRLRIERGPPPAGPRLHGSDARLLAAEENAGRTRWTFESPFPCELLVARLPETARVLVAGDAEPDAARERLGDTDLTCVRIAARGRFTVTLA